MVKNSDYLVTMGNKLKQCRKEQKLSQQKLAELSGIKRSTIGSYEKGLRTISKENELILSKVLSIDGIFNDEKNPTEELLHSLKRFKEANQLSSNELAELIRIDAPLLSRIEHGARKPSKRVIEQINDLLSKDPESVFHRISNEGELNHFPKGNKEEMGMRIHEIRKNREESLAKFGNKFTRPVGKNVVSRWEKGINIPDIERLMNIAYLGNTTATCILYGDLFKNMLKHSKTFNRFDKLDPVSMGKRLRKIRKERKLEREEFGTFFDPPIRKWSMDRYENGNDIPNTERIIQYAFLGNVSLKFLVYGKAKK